MKTLRRSARTYILVVIFAAAAATLLRALLAPSQVDLRLLAILSVAAALAQMFTVITPKHQHYHLTPVLFMAGIVLLDFGPLAVLFAAAHIPEWVRMRYPWYIQSFNIAMHIVAGFLARACMLALLNGTFSTVLTPPGVFAALFVAVLYILINHAMVGTVLKLARSVSFRDSKVLLPENVVTDLSLACLGIVAAVLWLVHPLLEVILVLPLVLIYRALAMPTLKEQALVDGKTGLANAKHFSSAIEEELGRAQRFHRPVAVVMADLDGLRHINNTYGHLAGDAVLGTIGRVIRQEIREYDTAARFGGEEFVVMMPETTMNEAYLVAERIRKAIAASPVEIRSQPEPIHVTISMGVSAYPDHGEDADSLIQAADVALYDAKQAGKNRVRIAVRSAHRAAPMQSTENRGSAKLG